MIVLTPNCGVYFMSKCIFDCFEMTTLVQNNTTHYGDVAMSAMASQIIRPTIVCSTVSSSADQRKHQSSASLVFVPGIHRWSVNSPHKGPVTRKMFPLDDVIMHPSVPRVQLSEFVFSIQGDAGSTYWGRLHHVGLSAYYQSSNCHWKYGTVVQEVFTLFACLLLLFYVAAVLLFCFFCLFVCLF